MLFFTVNANSQTSVDSVLASISMNNKTIIANNQNWEAKKLEFTTGLTPSDPKVAFDYLSGFPADAGNETEFTIIQSFDFPTAYSKKRQLSDEQIKLAEFHKISTRQNILLEAKLICIDLIYRNKVNAELSKRKYSTEKWLNDFQTKLDKGEGNILDVNKARIQLIEINALFQENISAINQLNQKLTELNGGMIINLSDTVYSPLPSIPDLESLLNKIEANDPVRKYMAQENIIAEKQVELSKAMALPKFEAGYRYQGILDQNFHGAHFGFTIPLWEHNNKVDAKKADLEFYRINLEKHQNELHYNIKQKYEKLSNLRITLNEYNNLFNSLNNLELLDKALSLGHISSIEYFMEMRYFYDAMQNYLKTEKEYHQTIAELYKFQL